MNTLNMKTIGSALVLSLAPLSANAVTHNEALEACASALAGEISGKTGIETAYRIDEELPASGRRLGRMEMFHLDARDPESQEVVARADCWVNRSAEVQRLLPVPIEAEDAEKRAASLY
jgi:hypothetical protein